MLDVKPIALSVFVTVAIAVASAWAVDGEVLPWHGQAAKAAAAAAERAAQPAAAMAVPAAAPLVAGSTAGLKPAVIEKIEPVVGRAAGEADRDARKPAGNVANDGASAPMPAGVDGKSPVDVIPAKKLFGAAKVPAPLAARAIGGYSRGCLAGATALPIDGPGWQAMRLSRNRNWGHPKLIAMLEKFAGDATTDDKWPGLLVGDISQPRGGPMLTGHASHQLGLDADIWFTPMPKKKLSKTERENLAATSMLSSDSLSVNPKVWGDGQVKIVKRVASYSQVERVLVHPAIKKALCEAAGTDRGWLGKVRPYWGHFYHFHVRMGCPADSAGCKPQPAPTGEEGCGKEIDDWYKRLTAPPPPKPTGPVKPVKPKPPVTLADMPQDCRTVLAATDQAKPGKPATAAKPVGVDKGLKPAAIQKTAAARKTQATKVTKARPPEAQ